MQSLCKLATFMIFLFCCSTPLFGMFQSDIDKVVAMHDVNEIEEFLKFKPLSNAIALCALLHLCKDDSVPHDKADILIRYAGEGVVALAERNFTEETYVIQQVKKKAEEISNFEAAINHDLAALDDTDVDLSKLKEIVDRMPEALNGNGHRVGVRETPIDDTPPRIGKMPNEVEQDTSRVFKDLEGKNNLSRRNRISFSYSFLKWFGLGVGIASLVYYLYFPKDKPVAQAK